jgi:hypothetical protein
MPESDGAGGRAVKPVCPGCGSTNIVPIEYGYPGPGWEAEVEKGTMALGGCVVGEGGYECGGCGRRF